VARRRGKIGVALAGLLASGTLAQEGPVYSTDTTLVMVAALVTDVRGAPVSDLSPSEFRLYADGAQQAIQNAWREEELPLVIAVIVDESPSQRPLVSEHRATVEAFLKRLLRAGDRAYVVRVKEEAALVAEFAGRSWGVGQVMIARGEPFGASCVTASGRHLCGETALWNGVFEVARLKLSRFAGARALLILSDGNDTGSFHHFDETLRQVERIGALAYAIRYGEAQADELSRLTRETGGAEFPPPDGDYRTALDRMQSDLRSHYVLTFRPDDAERGTHRLRVEVTRQGLTVRARKEYRVE
jgi:VWFA-related protein